MQKLKLKEEKITPKSHITHHTSQNSGITLVALIITIIVLLILAVVTIRSVQGDGIIIKAKDAKNKTIIAQEKEEIQVAVLEWSIQKSSPSLTFKKFMKDKLADIASIPDSNPDAGPLTVTMIKTNNVYIVKDDGTIIGPTENGGGSPQKVPDDLATYILGTDRTGRDLASETSTDGILSMSKMIFGKDPLNPSSTVYQDVKFAYTDDAGIIYIRYGRDVYSFKMTVVVDDNDTPDDKRDDTYNYLTVANSLNYERTPEGNLGKYVEYQGETWIVFREYTNGVELISANALGSVTLGGENFDDARTSYNNAISTLTQACIAATGITENIRNVGGPSEDETTNKVDFSTLTGFTPYEGSSFEAYEGETNGLKVGDTNYKSDKEQMENLGILSTDTPADYWLASREVEVDTSAVIFRMRLVDITGVCYYSNLCHVYGDDHPRYATDTCAVRPVVSLSFGIPDSATQSGTIDDPIILQ